MEYIDTEKVSSDYPTVVSLPSNKPATIHLLPPNKELPFPPPVNGVPVTGDLSQDTSSTSSSPTVESASTDDVDQQPTPSAKEAKLPSPIPSPSSASAPLPAVPSSSSAPKKTSTFRRITPRTTAARQSLPSSPLRSAAQLHVSQTPSSDSNIDRPNIPRSPPLHSRVTSISSVMSEGRPSSRNRHFTSDASPRRQLEVHSMTPAASNVIQSPHRVFSQLPPPPPPPKIPSPVPSRPSSTPAAPPVTSPQTSGSPQPKVTNRFPAPYRPGFQPKGVYRPRTDEFVLVRKTKSDAARIERTKLERRLEKLINLHFPVGGPEPTSSKLLVEQRRASSFFDLDISNIKNLDPTDILKGVLKSPAFQGAKGEIRGRDAIQPRCVTFLHYFLAAEQRLTPWQEDSTASKCPFCACVFRPSQFPSLIVVFWQLLLSSVDEQKAPLSPMRADYLFFTYQTTSKTRSLLYPLCRGLKNTENRGSRGGCRLRRAQKKKYRPQ